MVEWSCAGRSQALDGVHTGRLGLGSRGILGLVAGHLGGRQVAEHHPTLARPAVSLTFPPGIAASKEHLAGASGSGVLDGAKERLKVLQQLVLLDSEVVVEQVEELLLHEVDLGLGEEDTVPSPVLVLRRRVVEVLGCDNQGGKEDTMSCAMHALGNSWQTRLEAVEVDQCAKESGYLNIALLDQPANEGLQTGQARGLRSPGRVGQCRCEALGRSGRRSVDALRGLALDDVGGLYCKVSDHVIGYPLASEVEQRRVVDGLGQKACSVATQAEAGRGQVVGVCCGRHCGRYGLARCCGYGGGREGGRRREGWKNEVGKVVRRVVVVVVGGGRRREDWSEIGFGPRGGTCTPEVKPA